MHFQSHNLCIKTIINLGCPMNNLAYINLAVAGAIHLQKHPASFGFCPWDPLPGGLPVCFFTCYA